MIPALIAAAAPALIGLFTKGGGSTAEKVAAAASQVAQAITGKASDADALDALRSDPALMLEYQRQTAEQALALYQAETRRLEIVNASMQVEANAQDPYVRRWRPTWGYVTAWAWAIQSLAVVGCIAGAVVATLDGHTAAVSALLSGAAELAGALTVQWGIALTVLGVAVRERSKDKQAAAGITPAAGVLDLVKARLMPKGS